MGSDLLSREEYKVYQKWALLIDKCHFSAILPECKRYFFEHEGENMSIYLLIKVSSGLKNMETNLSKEKMDYKSLYKLSKMCCQVVDVNSLTLTKKNQFLSSLYHVMKYFVDKDQIESALQLKGYFLANKSDENEQEDVLSIYFWCYRVFHGISMSNLKLYIEGTRTSAQDLLACLDMSIVAVKFLLYSGTKYLTLILQHVHTVSQIIKSGINETCFKALFQFQMNVIKMINSIPYNGTIECDVVFKSYLNVIVSMVLHFIERNELDEIQDYLKLVVTSLKYVLAISEVHRRCGGLLESVVCAIVGPLVHSSAEDSVESLTACSLELTQLVEQGMAPALRVTCHVMGNIVIGLGVAWSKVGTEHWNCAMPPSVLGPLHKLLLAVADVRAVSDGFCVLPTGEKCPVSEDIVMAACIMSSVVQTVVLSGEHCTPNYKALLPQAKAAQAECYKLAAKLKAAGCPVWRKMFKSTVIKSYNLGRHCSKDEQHTFCKIFCLNLCQEYLQMDDVEDLFSEMQDVPGLAVRLLIQSYVTLNKLKKAQVLVVVGLLSFPHRKDDLMKLWVSIKTKSLRQDSTDVLACTLMDIIRNNESAILAINPRLNLKTVNFHTLLISELKSYSSFIPSVQCVVPAATALFLVTTCWLKRECGLEILLQTIWDHKDTQQSAMALDVCEEAITVLTQEDTQFPKDQKKIILLLLAKMYYWKFFHKLKILRIKTKQEIELGPELPVSSKDIDNVECNVIAAYGNLTVMNEAELLALLDQALVLWTKAFQQGLDMEVKDVLGKVEMAAIMFDLYGYEMHKLRAWDLHLKLAKCVGDKRACILSAIHLLEWYECPSNSPWLVITQGWVDELGLQNNSADVQLLVQYFLFRAFNSYINVRYAEGLDFLERVKQWESDQEVAGSRLLYAQYKLLQCRYMCMPRSLVEGPCLPPTPMLNTLRSGIRVLTSFAKHSALSMSTKENSVVLKQLLEVSRWTAELHLRLKWPREARCYIKQEFLLAQMASLPTRTGQLLLKLLHVDLLCCKLSDCEVKLQGLDQILGVKKHLHKQEIRASPIHLSLAGQSCCVSPVLYKPPFSLPEFVTHAACCACHQCNAPAQQVLMLEAAHVQAQMYVCSGEVREALRFMEGGSLLYGAMAEKHAGLLSQANPKLEQGWLKPRLADLMHSHIVHLVHYSTLLGMLGRSREAEDMCGQALRMLEGNLAWEVHLKAEFHEISTLFDMTKLKVPVLNNNCKEMAILHGKIRTQNGTVSERQKTPVHKSGMKPRRILVSEVSPNAVENVTPCKPQPPKFQLSPTCNEDELCDNVFNTPAPKEVPRSVKVNKQRVTRSTRKKAGENCENVCDQLNGRPMSELTPFETMSSPHSFSTERSIPSGGKDAKINTNLQRYNRSKKQMEKGDVKTHTLQIIPNPNLCVGGNKTGTRFNRNLIHSDLSPEVNSNLDGKIRMRVQTKSLREKKELPVKKKLPGKNPFIL